MAKKRQKVKKADQPAWSRRQFIISTTISTTIGLASLVVALLKSAPPVEVIVQVQPTPASVANLAGIGTMTLSATGDLSATPPDLV